MTEFLHALDPIFKNTLDGLAVAAGIISFFVTTLPTLTALASFVWLMLRIYETLLNIKERKHTEDE